MEAQYVLNFVHPQYIIIAGEKEFTVQVTQTLIQNLLDFAGLSCEWMTITHFKKRVVAIIDWKDWAAACNLSDSQLMDFLLTVFGEAECIMLAVPD